MPKIFLRSKIFAQPCHRQFNDEFTQFARTSILCTQIHSAFYKKHVIALLHQKHHNQPLFVCVQITLLPEKKLLSHSQNCKIHKMVCHRKIEYTQGL